MATKTFPVEAGHILMFARSVGDDNRVYSDADYAKTTEAGGIIAPDLRPGQRPVRPDYGLRPKIGQPWFGSGKNATGITRAPGGGGGGAAAACMPSSTSSITVRSRPATCSPPPRRPARPGKRKASARASWSSRERHRVPRPDGRTGDHRPRRRCPHRTPRRTTR
uniref:MaoC family dehydratase n=1 Tax=Phenylobacterium glaciei TaxID=2803784 RepID=A0A974S9X3_9CAUL|nr:MaoC family dehydratase [Phenylobacterium glaciei]